MEVNVTTETLAKFLPWLATGALITSFGVFSILVLGYGFELRDGINLFLSFAIAIFASVEGFSTYLQVKLEKDKNRLQEVRDELEKVYGPLYSIFFNKPDFKNGKAVIHISHIEKEKIDRIMVAFPFLLEPHIVMLYNTEIRNLEPVTPDPLPMYRIPMYFATNITIRYDNLTDEYHKRVGKELMSVSSFDRRLRRRQL